MKLDNNEHWVFHLARATLLFVLLIVPNSARGQMQFRDVSDQSGITFKHTDGSSGKRFIVETITGGVALLDYDGDGDLDIYFLNGAPLPGDLTNDVPTNELYRNDGDFVFTNVTTHAGVGHMGYGLGVAAADYDNDGATDLYVSNFGSNVLYHNNGDGTFSNETTNAHANDGQNVGAGVSFVDVDTDGNLDVYVANYVKFSFQDHKPHVHKGVPAYGSPLTYSASPDVLYRSLGDGTFEDTSEQSGITQAIAPGMGVISADYDDDGDVDIFVCNDVHNNFLWQNDGSGKFVDVALLSSTAFDLNGVAQGSMGVDAADVDNDGRIDFHVTSFAQEWSTMYHNLGGGLFEDNTRPSSGGAGTFPHVTWGNGFADFDNDGYQDLFIAAGHLDDNIHLRDRTTSYAVPNIVLHNQGDGKFVDISHQSGLGLAQSFSSRGAALGDLDLDGDVDIVVMNSRSTPTLLRNDSPVDARSTRIRLVGITSNRQGIGAKVKVYCGKQVQTHYIHSGRGYQSDGPKWVHVGRAQGSPLEKIEVFWGGGSKETHAPPHLGESLLIREKSMSLGNGRDNIQ